MNSSSIAKKKGNPFMPEVTVPGKSGLILMYRLQDLACFVQETGREFRSEIYTTMVVELNISYQHGERFPH